MPDSWWSLFRHRSPRDFYVVQHLGYDLIFEERPGAHGLQVTAKRGPLIGGFSESFSDFGAAKAYFDRLENRRHRGVPRKRATYTWSVVASLPP